MNIRPIRKSDNEELAQIIRGVFDEFDAPKKGTVYEDASTDDLYSLFQQERSILWVAEGEEGIYGCGGIFPTEGLDEDCAELVKLYLRADARGKGIGKELFERSIVSARSMGFKSLYLESIPEFDKAVGMYEKMGFRHLNAPLGNFVHCGCSLYMIMDL